MQEDKCCYHSESTLQNFVTFSQKLQTENRELSDFVRFCDHKMVFEIDSCVVTICVILDESTGLIPYICCEVIAKFKLLPFFGLIPFFQLISSVTVITAVSTP